MVMYNGKQIKEIRKSLGLTPKEFAALLGVSEGAISLWESEKRHPRWETMQRINKLATKQLNRQPEPA